MVGLMPGGMESLYDSKGYRPYAQDGGDVNENVDFFVALASYIMMVNIT